MNENLNYLAEIVIRALEGILGISNGYILDKREELKDQSKMETLLWLNNLDGDVMSRVATQVGVSTMDLDIARRVARLL